MREREANWVFKLPFGEELGAGTGSRTGGQGYGASDTNRWKYGMLQRDAVTGLDHSWFRKYENLSGRWTSPDPYRGSMSTADPQSTNRYTYTQSDPVNFVDPNGLDYFFGGFPPQPPSHSPSGHSGGSSGGAGMHDPLLSTNDGKDSGGGQTNSKLDCGTIRKLLFNNYIINKTLNDTWDKALQRKQEQGGLFGMVIDDGPYSGNWVAEPFYRQGGVSYSLKGMTDWAINKIAENKDSIWYQFSYHAHPFQKGEVTPEGETAEDPNQPSGKLGDQYSAEKEGLPGIVISKDQFVVYDKDKVLCRFRR